MTRFVGVPAVPLDANTPLVRTLMALKENVELLTNQRGEPDKASAALTAGAVSVSPVSGGFQALSARGIGVTMNNVTVPLHDDYLSALKDIQQLAVDVATLRDVVNQLIDQLRS